MCPIISISFSPNIFTSPTDVPSEVLPAAVMPPAVVTTTPGRADGAAGNHLAVNLDISDTFKADVAASLQAADYCCGLNHNTHTGKAGIIVFFKAFRAANDSDTALYLDKGGGKENLLL
jgi:hypothetical protein